MRIFVVEIDNKDTGMTTIELDMIQTAAIGALALIVPIIGAMFADLINTGIITFFLNIL